MRAAFPPSLALAALAAGCGDERELPYLVDHPPGLSPVRECSDRHPACATPVADGYDPDREELCGEDGRGDDLDNDGDGDVDEGCGPCKPGEVKPCFDGPPGSRGVGTCRDGTQRCLAGPDGETGWGDCERSITPRDDACDDADNDCDGCVDEGLCCSAAVSCDPDTVREMRPFEQMTLRGRDFLPGSGTFRWEIEGGPCEAVQATPTFDLAGADQETATFRPTLSGDYKVRLTVTPAGGEAVTCEFQVHVAGLGLRVELCWDTEGETDQDLHLHRAFDPESAPADWFTEDTCYYANCKSGIWTLDHWGYAPTGLENCQGDSGWEDQEPPGCRNPRLDLDNISDTSRPENINLDNPNRGERFRVMVNYFEIGADVDELVTHPVVNIYCGGHLRATFGAEPDEVEGYETPGRDGGGDMWRVADVTMLAGDNCAIEPILMGRRHHVTEGDSSFGPIPQEGP